MIKGCATRSDEKRAGDSGFPRIQPEGDRQTPLLSSLPAVLGDVHDLVLEDEQVGRALARQSNHVLVVVLDPSLDDLAIHQLDRDRLLFLTQGF